MRFSNAWSSKAGVDNGTHVLAFRVVNCQQKEVNSRVVSCLGPPTYIRILGNVSEKTFVSTQGGQLYLAYDMRPADRFRLISPFSTLVPKGARVYGIL